MESPDGRRSGRKRQPNKKYTVDAFEGLELDLPLKDSDIPYIPQDRDDDDEDFDAQAVAAVEQEDLVLDEAEELDGIADDDDQSDQENASVTYGDEDDEGPGVPEFQFRKPYVYSNPKAPSDKGRAKDTRGLDSYPKGSKESIRTSLFGSATEDQEPALRAKFKWDDQRTLPSRKANAGGFGGFHPSFYRTDKMRKHEEDNDWLWYDEEDGKEVFAKMQIFEVISEAVVKSYLTTTEMTREVICGPYGKQKPWKLSYGSSMQVNDPFKLDDNQPESSIRHGWMLNLSDKVRCLEWAPNQKSHRQYLAIATVPLSGLDPADHQKPYAPAFTPQDPRKAAIQIWEVYTDANNRISQNHRPRIRQVICTEYGDIKDLKWCPAPRKASTSDEGNNHLGLLTGLWTDGTVRILDITVSTSDQDRTQCLFCKVVAFFSRPPQTVFTAITWLSTHGIAAGCADGSLAIWNIPSSLKSSSTNPNAIPVFFSQLQFGYILALTTAYPSRPQILLATATTGYISMTDLNSVTLTSGITPSNTIFSPRTRVGRQTIAWHDYSQMLLSVDDNYTLQGNPLRRFYGTSGMTRFKAPSMCVAVSPVHPFVVAGTLAGHVVCHNPLRRTLDHKKDIWNQIWFVHEWRRREAVVLKDVRRGSDGVLRAALAEIAANAAGAKDTDGDVAMRDGAAPATNTHNVDAGAAAGQSTVPARDPGLVRITESYKAEKITLMNDGKAFANREKGAAFTTVYEKESAVTALAWNPNIHVGGWCAAGMATGLVRIEDIASGE